jgi:hypothetical protein
MEVHTIGIDLGKTLFHLVGVDSRGRRGCFVVKTGYARSWRFLVSCSKPYAAILSGKRRWVKSSALAPSNL